MGETPQAALAQRAGAWAAETSTVIGGTEYTFRKLLPMEAFDLLEDLRTHVNPQGLLAVLGTIDAKEGASTLQLASAIATLPRMVSKEGLAIIRGKVFTAVDFCHTEGNNTPSPIIAGALNDEPRAFMHSGPLAVYEVLLRGLAINFFGYFSALLSQLAAVLPATE